MHQAVKNKVPSKRDLAYAYERAGIEVKSVIGKFGWPESDREDLIQELVLHVLQKWARYDRSKASPRRYITVLIRNRIHQLIRKQKLARSAFGNEGGKLHSGIDRDRRRRERTEAEEAALAELSQVFGDITAQMSPQDREFCQLLSEGRSVLEIAKITGCCRQQITARIEQIREDFQKDLA